MPNCKRKLEECFDEDVANRHIKTALSRFDEFEEDKFPFKGNKEATKGWDSRMEGFATESKSNVEIKRQKLTFPGNAIDQSLLSSSFAERCFNEEVESIHNEIETISDCTPSSVIYSGLLGKEDNGPLTQEILTTTSESEGELDVSDNSISMDLAFSTTASEENKESLSIETNDTNYCEFENSRDFEAESPSDFSKDGSSNSYHVKQEDDECSISSIKSTFSSSNKILNKSKKVSDWLDEVHWQLHTSEENFEDVCPDSTKKKKKFIANGLSEQYYKMKSKEQSSINIWKYAMKFPNSHESNKTLILFVEILSIFKEYSVYLALCQDRSSSYFNGQKESVKKARLQLEEDLTATEDTQQMQIIFSEHVVKELQLKSGCLVKIHPSWQKLRLSSLDRDVVMCANFVELVLRNPPKKISFKSKTYQFSCPCRNETFVRDHCLLSNGIVLNSSVKFDDNTANIIQVNSS